MKIDLKKLQKQKDIQFVELNPKGKYLILVDSRKMGMREVERLKIVPGLKWAVAVEGKPEESIAIYEIKE